MKSITEFAVFALQKGQTVHAELLAQGKTPEEISTQMGESFKLEGDKLKYFINALDVAKQATSGRLKRVMIVSFGENESVPARAVKVEETHYLPEYHLEAPKAAPEGDTKNKGAGGGRGKGRDRNNNNNRGGGNRRKRPENAAQTEELKKYASSDGRAGEKPASGEAVSTDSARPQQWLKIEIIK